MKRTQGNTDLLRDNSKIMTLLVLMVRLHDPQPFLNIEEYFIDTKFKDELGLFEPSASIYNAHFVYTNYGWYVTVFIAFICELYI